MLAEDLTAFVADVQSEAERALARLAAVDPATLPPELRGQYEQVKAGWEELRAMTEADAVELHEAACVEAGRELTLDELRGLVLRQ